MRFLIGPLPRPAGRALALVLASLLALALVMAGPRAAATVPPPKAGAALLPAELAGRLQGTLADVYAEAATLTTQGAAATPGAISARSPRVATAIAARSLRFDARGALQVDALISGDGPSPQALAALGVRVERHRPDLGRAQYRLPLTSLGALAGLEGVLGLRPPTYAYAHTGSRLSEGDAALRADVARQLHGISGAGVRVGVISDGIDGLVQAQATGDAPVLVDPRSFSFSGLEGGSEGTAMIEIVHDLAPGAAISFANPDTDLDMIDAVNYLAQRNDIVVDDLGFFFPDDQQSPVSLNAAAALNNPAWPIRAYVTAVGNSGAGHFQGAYTAGPEGSAVGIPEPGRVHQFTASADTTDVLSRGTRPYNEVYLGPGDAVDITLFWQDRWGGAANDYDLYLVNSQNQVVEFSIDAQAGDPFDVPRERLAYVHDGAPDFFQIAVHNWQNRAAVLPFELFVFDSPPLPGTEILLNFNTPGSSMLANNDAGGGVISVGALDHTDPALARLRAYSSRGPTNNGALKPEIVAVDGVAVTGAAGFPDPFFGTSAAAPHVAAIAALTLQARSSLLAADGGNPEQERALLRALLFSTAVDLGAPGADTTFGNGRIDAVRAADEAIGALVDVTSSADSGPGSFRAAIEAVNAASAADGSRALEIGFPAAGVTITVQSPLPVLTANTVAISGASAVENGAAVRIDGSALTDPAAAGLVVQGSGVFIGGITLRGFPGAGLHLDGAADATVADVRVEGNGLGVRVDNGASGVRIGDDLTTGVAAIGNAAEGILVTGADVRDIIIRSSFIGVDTDGRPAPNGADGIRVGEGAQAVVIGAAAEAAPVVAPVLAVAQTEELSQTFIGIALLDGVVLPAGTRIEVFLDGQFSGATELGLLLPDDLVPFWPFDVPPDVDLFGVERFVLTVPGPGTTVTFTVDGQPAVESFPFEPGMVSIIELTVDTAAGRPDLYTLPGGNSIAHNVGSGVRVEGEATGGVTLRANAISGNGRADVDLAAPADGPDGRTPNDPLDNDRGPNGLLNSPSIGRVTFSGDSGTVTGTTPRGATVDLYVVTDPAGDPADGASATGAGGALRYLGTAVTDGTRFTLANVLLPTATAITALATDANGNTSEFALNQPIPPAPVIASLAPTSGGLAGGTLVTIIGESFRFGPDFQVIFGSSPAEVESITAATVVVRTPAGLEGVVDVRVVNANGRSATLSGGFAYRPIFAVTLRPGWNLVTWLGAPTPTPAAIQALAGAVDRLYAWEAATQRFLAFVVGVPASFNDLRTLETGQALWVFVSGGRAVDWEQPLAPAAG